MKNTLLLLPLLSLITFSAGSSPCKKTCGSLVIKYPFGSGTGCGSPRFHPYITCPSDHLLLTTHTGAYPITSVDYDAAVITVSPPCMSNCTSVRPAPVPFGLDRAGPFQLGPSAFILLACSSATFTITYRGNSVCDPSSAYLCASFYSCPAAAAAAGRMEVFSAATNSCCVYAPANLDGRDELDVGELGCGGYSSVAVLGDVPTDAARWSYGVAVKYTMGGLDGYNVAPGCRGCEISGGVCGYAPPGNNFVCVCEYGNTTTDCSSYNWYYTSSASGSDARSWVVILVVLVVVI